MRVIPWWAVLSSVCAPAVLIGGWVLAGLLRGPGYDPAAQTISSLEADGAPYRWLIVGGLAALGVCHLVTALGLRPAALLGRIALAGGGVCSILVALFPPPLSGGSLRHGVVVGLGFALLSVWPWLAVGLRSQPGGIRPWALRPVPALLVSGSMLAGAAWFLIALRGHGPAGAVERVLTTTQSCWPFIVVVSCAYGAPAGAVGMRSGGGKESLDPRRPGRR